MTGPVQGQPQGDLGEMMREGLARAGVELDRLRRVAVLQANLTAVRLRRRGQREALAERVLALHRRGELGQPDLVSLCEALEAIEADIRAQEDQITAVRRGGGAEPQQAAAPDEQAATQERRRGGVVVLPTGERLCAVCRTPVGDETIFCPTCGVRL
ncbi:MAG: hypothetical protein NVSMB65_12040 [Chloroflexota bacterium]